MVWHDMVWNGMVGTDGSMYISQVTVYRLENDQSADLFLQFVKTEIMSWPN